MKVTFITDRILLSGQKITAGETIECSAEDGAAFIANGVATEVVTEVKKGVKADG